MEAVVYLALAVILLRGFVVEGYMISTGSMAPCLLGYHRQVICPSCAFAFSRGTHVEADNSILASGNRANSSESGSRLSAPSTVCPNCGLSAIDVAAVPRNEGDQLLVLKHFYQLRSPRRWEIVVFRHPGDAVQAYVKRVVGLPGETIELMNGDVYADGEVQRKSLDTQRSIRILVFDQDHEPTDADGQTRWRADGDSRWQPYHSGFIHRRATGGARSPSVDWLTYHHCARRLARRSTDVDRHEVPSHECPIVDEYAYNHPDAGDGPFEVHDLMAEVVVRRAQGEGEWRLRMTDGWHLFEAVFDFSTRTVQLYVDGASEAIREGPLSGQSFIEETSVEMSLFDRQVLVAIDGHVAFEPLSFVAGNQPRQSTNHPVQVGAAGMDLQLSHLRLYRDVYYTPKQSLSREGASRLGSDELFMLGDNSPVSVDSRSWESPAIPRMLLIGKPFLVHLPSKQREIEFAGQSHHIRIPDFSRVRYIR